MKRLMLAAAVLAIGSSAWAAPIVYESASHASPGVLSGNTADAGLAAWDGTNQHDIGTPGKGYTDGTGKVLPAAGNYVAGVVNEVSFAVIDTTLWPASHKTGDDLGAAGATIWMSFISKCSAAGANQWSGIALFVDGDERLFLGNPYAPTTWGMDLKVGSTPTTQVSVDQERFILVRMAWRADGTNVDIDMWLNPPLANEAGLATVPATDHASGTRSNFQFDRMRLAGNVQTDWDEIRLGLTYNDVALPEPATLVLLAAGAAATALARRKR